MFSSFYKDLINLHIKKNNPSTSSYPEGSDFVYRPNGPSVAVLVAEHRAGALVIVQHHQTIGADLQSDHWPILLAEDRASLHQVPCLSAKARYL